MTNSATPTSFPNPFLSMMEESQKLMSNMFKPPHKEEPEQTTSTTSATTVPTFKINCELTVPLTTETMALPFNFMFMPFMSGATYLEPFFHILNMQQKNLQETCLLWQKL